MRYSALLAVSVLVPAIAIAGPKNEDGVPQVDIVNTPDVNVVNTPGVEIVNGSLAVDDGGGSLTIDGTVSVNEPVTVEGIVSLDDGGSATTDNLGAIAIGQVWSVRFSFLTRMDRVTVVSMSTLNHPSAIVFQKDEVTVAAFFAEPGAPLNVTLTHPLVADSYYVECLSVGNTCEGSFAVSGYLSSP